jgi:hypothetical protein
MFNRTQGRSFATGAANVPAVSAVTGLIPVHCAGAVRSTALPRKLRAPEPCCPHAATPNETATTTEARPTHLPATARLPPAQAANAPQYQPLLILVYGL